MIFLNRMKPFFICVTLLLLALPLLIPAPVLAIDSDTTPPVITIENISVIDGVTKISGKISDDQTPADQILLELYDSNDQLIKTILPSIDGSWLYEEAIPFSVNTLYLKATDSATPSNNKQIPVDNKRPHVKGVNISVFLGKNQTTQADVTKQVDMMQNEDMTRISLNPTIIIDLEDNDVIDKQNLSNPITVFNKNGTVSGNVSINDKKQIVFLLQNLSANTSYYIMFNQTLTDDAGNAVYPVIKKFTTVSSTLNSIYNGGAFQYNTDREKLPHGYYTNNVNTCINCHNTHVSEGTNLENPNSGYTPKDLSLADSYCMACHDGTSAAPLPDKLGANIISKHETQVTDHSSKAGSCTSCHNPHLTWSSENPNLLKDHFVYNHQTEDVVEGVKVGEIDSRQQLCEKCHELNTNYYKNLASDLVKKLNDPNNPDAYKIMHYQKLSSTGIVKNYDLCFSCHNDGKETETNGVIKDILKYYEDSNSKHIITAVDGSPLNGSLPCSECHETHGSTNLLLLKDKLGHENQQAYTLTLIEDWTDQKKRDFCISCHNGETAIFGVTGKAIYDKDGVPINTTNPNAQTGHAKTSSVVCSACHSDNNSFIEAVHAPKQGK
jgi:hypothetical protein